jgi:cation transport ATPase
MDLTTLHLISLIITAPVILYADHMGFQYFTGRVQTLSLKKVEWTHRLVTGGLLLLIITGITITIPVWAIMLEKPLFYAKLAFVATLVSNGIFIGQLMQKALVTPYANLSQDEKRFLLVSGVVSACGWSATILIGFFGV